MASEKDDMNRPNQELQQARHSAPATIPMTPTNSNHTLLATPLCTTPELCRKATMQITYRDDLRLEFKGPGLVLRILMFVWGALALVGGGLFAAISVAVILPQAVRELSWGLIFKCCFFLAGGLFCIFLGVDSAVLALPFRLELHRNPLRSRYRWRAWTIKHVDYGEADAVVLRPSGSKHGCPFALYIRTGSKQQFLLKSPHHAPSEAEAFDIGSIVANDVADFAGCKVELEGWSDALMHREPLRRL